MKIQEKYFEGSTKKLFIVEEDDALLMEFLDVYDSGDAKKKTTVKGKGAINTKVSSFMFDYLNNYNVPTHFIRKIDEKSVLVKKLNMFPFTVMVWNVASGTLSKRIGLKEGHILETPVMELYLKNAKLKYPMINDFHAYTLGLCDRNEMNGITRISTKVNAVLKSFFTRKNLALANFSLEFGKFNNQIMLADEISPDNFSVWEQKEAGKLDKKTFEVTPDQVKSVYPKIKDIILS